MDAQSFVAGVLVGVVLRWLHKPMTRKLPSKERHDLLSTPYGEAEFLSRVGSYHSSRSDLDMGARLGTGSFGEVFEASWRGALVAVKILRHHTVGTESNNAVSFEAMIAVATVHPNVVPVYEVFSRVVPRGEQRSEFGEETFIVMEKADRGSLLSQGPKLSEEFKCQRERGLLKILRCLLDTALALEYLHGISVVHGDLKPANILCKSVGGDARGYICKVCDFGLASSSATLSPNKLFTTTQNRGGLLYAAPERLAGERPGLPSDIYSLGTLAWQLFDFHVADASLPDAIVLFRMMEHNWLPELDTSIPEDMRRFISSCWSRDPAERLSAMQARLHLSQLLKDVLMKRKRRLSQDLDSPRAHDQRLAVLPSTSRPH